MTIARARLSRVPGRGNTPPVRRSFLVTGTLDGSDAKTVVLVLKDAKQQEVPFDPPVLTVVRTRDAGATRSVRWVAKVTLTRGGNNLPAGNYTLVAIPIRMNGMRYDPGTSRPPRALQWDGMTKDLFPLASGIAHPPQQTPPYRVVGDEADLLYATGDSDVPVWNATLTEVGTSNTRAANYVYWVSEMNYWVAEFLYLRDDPGAGLYDLTLDVAGSPTTRIEIA